jgi:hypothetical protein
MVNERYIVIAEKYLQYRVPNRTAVYTNVPISELALFRKVMKMFGITYKMRYRGPRFNVPSASRRFPISKQSTCLLEDATHFSAYMKH